MDLSLFWYSPDALFAVEAILVIVTLAFTCRFAAAERVLGKLARHRLAPLAVGAFAMVLRAVALPVAPIPNPNVSDEFSYLLGADTFAHGRLTNPPHPMWEHFETFHEDQLPTYQSMYPPLQGLVLGAGQAFLRTPYAGVWLGAGLMCSAFCWGLRGWFPPGWALLGAAIAAIRLAMFSYWGNSYWGGALAATGGALLFGALPRLIRSSRPRDALIAALGLAMMANTRPYEGAAFSVGVGLVALWRVRQLRLRTILPPLCCALALVGALMAYYDWRVFGSPTTLPYTVNRATYAVTPYFMFQSLRPEPVYRHKRLRDFYTGWEVQNYQAIRSKSGFVRRSMDKIYTSWIFFLGPVLTIPLVASVYTWRSRRTGILLFLAAAVVLANAVVPFFVPHYVAPVTIVLYALIVQGLRTLRPAFPRLVRAVPVICVLMVGVRLGMAAAAIPVEAAWPMSWARLWPAELGRENIAAEILANGGKHVVIVHYKSEEGGQFVFNDADIDASPIVWANDMGPEKNAELLHYYSSRKAWVLNVDGESLAVSPLGKP